ncbi:hypothetical protein [Campylobacter lari]|uniref:hypothetical protein n=1 Tax=Campylobacter lari TaxID=201 RepID=UPI0021584650|nr:hypothetical protein [Campylobacter lari]MCR6775042.1 hypothetical protein [Campylobacter lari]
MNEKNIGGIGDFNSYGSGRFAHPNIKFDDIKKSNSASGRNIFNALSEIQRYHVIEERSEEIPKEYFTIEQIIDYFKIGFKSGFLESFIFAGLICFLQILYPSYKYYFLGKETTNIENILISVSTYGPLIASTFFMAYISKYYKGLLTKRAIFSLMNGRSFTFILKGVGVFYLFMFLKSYSLENPSVIYSWTDWTLWLAQWFNPSINVEQLYVFYYRFVIPSLHDSAHYFLYSMIIFALLPYFTIFYKGFVRKKQKLEIEEEYEKY